MFEFERNSKTQGLAGALGVSVVPATLAPVGAREPASEIGECRAVRGEISHSGIRCTHFALACPAESRGVYALQFMHFAQSGANKLMAISGRVALD